MIKLNVLMITCWEITLYPPPPPPHPRFSEHASPV